MRDDDLIEITTGGDRDRVFLDSAGRVVNEKREWRCSYCQMLNQADALQCRGCGASS